MKRVASLGDIPRNDLPACYAYYVHRGREITSNEFHILLLLQDDQSGLLRMASGWQIKTEND